MIKKFLKFIVPDLSTSVIMALAGLSVVIFLSLSSHGKEKSQFPQDYYINGDKFTQFTLKDNITCVTSIKFGISCVHIK